MLALALAVVGCGSSQTAPVTALRVQGNRLVFGGSGHAVQLRGINRSGTEYECANGFGYFDSPTPSKPDSQAMVAAMKSWDINVVRVPLNEGCWLGVNAPSRYSGAHYQAAIAADVRRLTADHLFVILSLQWGAPGSTHSDLQLPMADEDHSPSFWQSVASRFKNNQDVMFDLYNEPFNISWSCWENGCQIPAGHGSAGSWPSYQAAGMQQLVSAVRSTGATQPLLLGGNDYALDLSEWLSHEPRDPDHALVASIHSYGGISPCETSCLAAVVRTSKKVPVVFGELGETDCSTDYIDPMMAFADEHHIGYLGWAWDAVKAGSWSCNGGPSLIDSYDGSPTAYGFGFQSHFRSLGVATRP